MAPSVPHDYTPDYFSIDHENTVRDQVPMAGTSVVAQPHSQPQNSGHAAFLNQWQQSIQPRLTQLLAQLGSHEVAKSLALAQIITYLPVLTEGKQLLKAEALCLLGNPALQDFHVACCHQGLPLTQLGPMGKVWESGVVQVVQHAGNLPTDAHPLNILPPELATAAIDEIVYLPVYDSAPGTTVQGVVAALELMVSPRSMDVMVVANLISTVAETMGQLGLALSNPVQAQHTSNQPSDGRGMARKRDPYDSGMKQGSSYENNNHAWTTGTSVRSFNSGGGGMGQRTMSVRTMGGLSRMNE
ncbi:hypothetical protein Ndes2526B_g08481 [Nannochloris sp. 'desiccata']|nr:hypothetical protein KSW81_001918 [Chlorella desiccata (nom. nud.)]KAH7616367.1 hypothetical protein NADE_001187 [Chlorella desiccata (nom. nud.)]KAH7616388.1 hypothetical protein NADE_001208 [Chlorella desiccata (nom. nud.)]